MFCTYRMGRWKELDQRRKAFKSFCTIVKMSISFIISARPYY